MRHVGSFIRRPWRYWMNDIRRRRGCIGKGFSVSIGLLILVCMCSIPVAVIDSTGRALGVLPTLTPTPLPTATRPPTTTPTATSSPTTEPTITPTATTDPAIAAATAEAFQQIRATAAAERAWPCQPDQIKGNINSGIYHVPGQQDYEKTRNNVACFNTEIEAETAGYRKAQR